MTMSDAHEPRKRRIDALHLAAPGARRRAFSGVFGPIRERRSRAPSPRIRLPAALSAAQRQRNVMKTCVHVVFCAKPAAGAYSGKVYALCLSLGAWQTFCAGPLRRRGMPVPSPRRRRGKNGIAARFRGFARRPPTTWGAGLADASALAGVKVMVIDDSNTIRRSAEIFLLQAGCTVILAEDGFDALAKITDHQPDLVFVDIMMPRLDGYQTCALIKKNNRFHGTPVVMLSSKDGLFDRARGRMVGSDQYLTKPFTKESLLKAVAAHVKAAA
jgi:twitching motility two-component system response regulator PilG